MSCCDFGHLFETYKSAVLTKDAEALMAMYDEDFLAFDLWDAWLYESIEPWRRMNFDWLGSLGSGSVGVEFGDIKTFSSGDIAVACAIVTYMEMSESGEIVRSMQNRLTWVVHHKDSVWKIVHQHSSVPISSNTMSPIVVRG